MLALALDTATQRVGAAVVADSGEILGAAALTATARHGELLAPLVVRALAEAGATPKDLGLIAVGTGPGPFTGLRVGLVHARVMGLALGIPVHGICTLDVLAAQVQAAGAAPPEGFVVATDARRREVYWARYDGQGNRVAGPAVSSAASIPDGPATSAFGAGALLYPDSFASAAPPEYPDAGMLGRLVLTRLQAGDPPGDTQPLYLRRPDAQENVHRKRVLK